MSELMLDVSQAEELKLAFRRNGWNNAQIKTLSEGDLLAKVLKVITGQAVISYPEYSIDCDAAPFIPDGWTVEEHKPGGMYKYSQSGISLYLPDKQKTGSIEGNKLRKLLVDKPVLNANVLDYLLDHPELIPEEWKGKAVFFWGTIYRNSNGTLYIRCLDWFGSELYGHYRWLDLDFRSGRPSAVAILS